MEDNLSPMLQQYRQMKNEVGQDTLLFFRLGDFYELFFEDAVLVSKELDLILTARAAGNNQKAPMCGVPHHAASSYMQRLVDRGYKIAIAQQMEDPAQAKGLVKRAITKIVTQGTNLEVASDESHLLLAIEEDLINYHLCFYDITNNQLYHQTIDHDGSLLISQIKNNQSKEILIEQGTIGQLLEGQSDISITYVKDTTPQPTVQKRLQQRIKDYLQYTQKQTIIPKQVYQKDEILQLDANTITNLELISPLRLQSKSPTLFKYLDKTNTVMGKRNLKQWIMRPLTNKVEIEARQNEVTYLKENLLLRHQINDHLNNVFDVERIATKILFNSCVAQDLLRLKTSLQEYESIKKLLSQSPLQSYTPLNGKAIVERIEKMINPNAPSFLKDGNTIADHVNEQLDHYRMLLNQGNQWLLEYEIQEKERTGIKNLKIGYSKAHGYYIEVSKGQIPLVQDSFGYMPRQTLTNAQRYISAELKNREDELQQAATLSIKLEEQLFNDFVVSLQKEVDLISEISNNLAIIDTLCALAQVSSAPGFIKPVFSEDQTMRLIENKHPILTQTLAYNQVVSNDLISNPNECVLLLTGPNMGGKSTYMRQIALAVIMAQMGCYVMAKEAYLPIFDKIFTRMGASDDILSNQSTFMVEMVEANTALTYATKHSLILFDEIGRGTSTYDGMAIAHSMIEYIANKIGCKTIFSTHYHELTGLDKTVDGVRNAQVAVSEKDNKITFLYKVIDGCADRSYGIHVAKLAHLPNEVIVKAQQVLGHYQAQQGEVKPVSPLEFVAPVSKTSQLIRDLDINAITPLQALQILQQCQTLENENE